MCDGELLGGEGGKGADDARCDDGDHYSVDAAGVNRRRKRREDDYGRPSLALSVARRWMPRPSPSSSSS